MCYCHIASRFVEKTPGTTFYHYYILDLFPFRVKRLSSLHEFHFFSNPLVTPELLCGTGSRHHVFQIISLLIFSCLSLTVIFLALTFVTPEYSLPKILVLNVNWNPSSPQTWSRTHISNWLLKCWNHGQFFFVFLFFYSAPFKYLTPLSLLYLYKMPSRPNLECCCYVWAGDAHSLLASLDRVQKQLIWYYYDNYFPSYTSFPHGRNVAIPSLFHHYFHDMFPD